MRKLAGLAMGLALLGASLVVPAPTKAVTYHCHSYQVKVAWTVHTFSDSATMTAYPCTTYGGSDWRTSAAATWVAPDPGNPAVRITWIAPSSMFVSSGGAYYMSDGSNRIDFWTNLSKGYLLCTTSGNIDLTVYLRVKKARTGPGVSTVGTTVINRDTYPAPVSWRIVSAGWIS